ncbi:hypothetical protein ACFE04_030448 [Oxalis oulophora]
MTKVNRIVVTDPDHRVSGSPPVALMAPLEMAKIEEVDWMITKIENRGSHLIIEGFEWIVEIEEVDWQITGIENRPINESLEVTPWGSMLSTLLPFLDNATTTNRSPP